MRTLFLICILAALVVIAAKDPGESVLDVANGFAEDVGQFADQVDDTKTVSTTISSVISQAQQLDNAPNTSLDDIMTNAGFSVNDAETPTPTTETVTQEPPKQLPEDSPASEVDGWQGLLPTGPVPEMDVAQFPVFSPDFSATSAPEVSPVLNAQDTYSEVKDYYENASQLLSEIQ
jgi:hypothetical protein